MAPLTIREFTDPGCPFAFSAEPARWRIEWLYGDQLEWSRRMVVLSQAPDDYVEKGFTPEKQAEAYKRMRREHGMPIDAHERPRMAATEIACRAVVAARLHAPERERALLRQLRVLGFAGQLIDERETIERAARHVGLAPDDLLAWMEEPAVHEALAEDMADARSPSAAALVLFSRLAETDDGHRYTCPSYQFQSAEGRCFDIPGFRPVEAYEVAIANLASELDRRSEPDRVEEVLAWAVEPLATVEVAAVAKLEPEQAREELARVADFQPVGNDGYWTLRVADRLAADAAKPEEGPA
ncbi:MAG: DsbA family protein [Actinomycetota bacterium]|nr:DsbA family protein [Actinomycetota bacterium]